MGTGKWILCTNDVNSIWSLNRGREKQENKSKHTPEWVSNADNEYILKRTSQNASETTTMTATTATMERERTHMWKNSRFWKYNLNLSAFNRYSAFVWFRILPFSPFHLVRDCNCKCLYTEWEKHSVSHIQCDCRTFSTNSWVGRKRKPIFQKEHIVYARNTCWILNIRATRADECYLVRSDDLWLRGYGAAIRIIFADSIFNIFNSTRI